MKIKVVCSRKHKERVIGMLTDRRPDVGESFAEVAAGVDSVARVFAEAGQPMSDDERDQAVLQAWRQDTSVFYVSQSARVTARGGVRRQDHSEHVGAGDSSDDGRVFWFRCDCGESVRASDARVLVAVDEARREGRSRLQIQTLRL